MSYSPLPKSNSSPPDMLTPVLSIYYGPDSSYGRVDDPENCGGLSNTYQSASKRPMQEPKSGSPTSSLDGKDQDFEVDRDVKRLRDWMTKQAESKDETSFDPYTFQWTRPQEGIWYRHQQAGNSSILAVLTPPLEPTRREGGSSTPPLDLASKSFVDHSSDAVINASQDASSYNPK